MNAGRNVTVNEGMQVENKDVLNYHGSMSLTQYHVFIVYSCLISCNETMQPVQSVSSLQVFP